MPRHRERSRTTLTAIAIFRLIKAALFLVIAIAAISAIGKDVSELAEHILDELHFDANSSAIDRVLNTLSGLEDKQLKLIGAGALTYAALFFTEGIGLLLRKRWAEYFTAIITGSFIPFEVIELAKHVTIIRILVLASNVAILIYLVLRLLSYRREDF